MRLAIAATVWVAAALAAGCGADGRTVVQVAIVERRDLVQVIAAKGRVEPAGYKTVGAERMGRVIAVLGEEGEWVKKGQPLARLEAIQPEADVAGREARLAQLRAEANAVKALLSASAATQRAHKATLERLETELRQAASLGNRAELLHQDGLIARQELDRRREALASAEALVAEANESGLRLNAQHQQLTARRKMAEDKTADLEADLRRLAQPPRTFATASPMNGMVTDLRVPVGETVVPGVDNTSASLIITVADMSRVTAQATVSSADLPKVKLGQSVEIVVDGLPGESLAAEITQVGGPSNEFQVTAELENPPKSLRPGIRCALRIVTAKHRGALAAPSGAFVFRSVSDTGDDAGDRTLGVFVVEAESVRFRPVETGVEVDGRVEILSGLKAGERIVTGEQALRSLQSGDKVRAKSKT